MIKRYRWVVVGLLCLGGVINYVDRSAFSVAAPLLAKEYGISSGELGLIFSSFSIGYVLFNFVGGYLSDLYGPRGIFAVAMMVWSFFCALTATAFNFSSLFIIRLLFGFGEGPLGSATNKTLSNWVPAEQRARAVGIAFAGNPLGAAIAGPIVAAITVFWNWRISFVILGVLGFVWAFAWLRLVTDHPADNRHVSPEEAQETAGRTGEQPEAQAARLPLSFFLKQPTILCTAFSFFGFNYILYFFLSWFPSYLSMQRGLDIKQLSIVTMIPWMVGSVGLVLSGITSDALVKRLGHVLAARKLLLVAGTLVSSVCVALAGGVETTFSATALMTAGIFFMYMTATSYWSIISDCVAKEKVGGVTGFVHAVANIAGIVAPTLTGYIVQYVGKFDSAFYVAGGLGLAGALCVAIFVRPIGEAPAATASLDSVAVR